MSVNYCDAVSELIRAVPEFNDESERIHYDPILPHVLLGEFTWFVVRLLGRPVQNKEILGRIFQFIETLAASDDVEARALAQVSFLENLGKVDWALERAKGLMGPRSKILLQQLEEFFAGRRPIPDG
jgi:hypothetical protein